MRQVIIVAAAIAAVNLTACGKRPYDPDKVPEAVAVKSCFNPKTGQSDWVPVQKAPANCTP